MILILMLITMLKCCVKESSNLTGLEDFVAAMFSVIAGFGGGGGGGVTTPHFYILFMKASLTLLLLEVRN